MVAKQRLILLWSLDAEVMLQTDQPFQIVIGNSFWWRLRHFYFQFLLVKPR